MINLMKDEVYKRSDFHHYFYLKRSIYGVFMILLLYVDDHLVASNYQDKIMKLLPNILKKLTTKDLGEAKKILDMYTMRDDENSKLWLSELTISQRFLKDLEWWIADQYIFY